MAIVNVDLSEYGKRITLSEPQLIALKLVRNINFKSAKDWRT